MPTNPGQPSTVRSHSKWGAKTFINLNVALLLTSLVVGCAGGTRTSLRLAPRICSVDQLPYVDWPHVFVFGDRRSELWIEREGRPKIVISEHLGLYGLGEGRFVSTGRDIHLIYENTVTKVDRSTCWRFLGASKRKHAFFCLSSGDIVEYTPSGIMRTRQVLSPAFDEGHSPGRRLVSPQMAFPKDEKNGDCSYVNVMGRSLFTVRTRCSDMRSGDLTVGAEFEDEPLEHSVPSLGSCEL